MTTWIHFLLFLNLALCLFTATTIDEDHNQHLAIIHFINALPPNSQPMEVRCSSNSKNTDLGVHTLVVGEDYKWGIEEKTMHFCEAIWERFIASWHVFQPHRDNNHGIVFWMVKKDGFFLSWDKVNWVRKSIWETE